MNMLENKVVSCITIIFTTLNQITCDSKMPKFDDAKAAALDTYYIFTEMFTACVSSPMPDQHFLMDNLKSFVNYPSKTTIGLSLKFTNNRKFFANMIGSAGFKDMLAKDEEELRRELIRKINYCNKVIMDANVLNEFHDREVDLSKM